MSSNIAVLKRQGPSTDGDLYFMAPLPPSKKMKKNCMKKNMAMLELHAHAHALSRLYGISRLGKDSVLKVCVIGSHGIGMILLVGLPLRD